MKSWRVEYVFENNLGQTVCIMGATVQAEERPEPWDCTNLIKNWCVPHECVRITEIKEGDA